MAEKPLTHHKRKANPEKMKPDMRQLEDNFTVYDFERTPRRSYYPRNQHITTVHSQGSADNAVPMLALSSQTNTYVQTSTASGRSRSSSLLDQAGQSRHSSQRA